MNMKNLRRIYAYLQPHRGAVVLSIICMIASGLLTLAFFVLFQNVLSGIMHVAKPEQILKGAQELLNHGASDAQIGAQVRAASNQPLDRSVMLQQLNWFMVVVILWAIARVVVDFTMQYLTQRTGQLALAQLRLDLFAHFQRLSISFFESRRTGDIMSRLTNDLGALQTVLTIAVIAAIRAPVEALGSLGFMFYTNWKLSLFVFLILPPMALLINRAGQRIRRATAALQAQLGELTNYLQEKIAAMRLIQTFGTRDYEIARFAEVNEEAYRRTMKPIRIQASLGPSIEFTGYMGVFAVLWFGARSGMAPEDLLVFLFAMHRAAMNFKAVASLSNMFKSADAAADRLFEMLDAQPEVVDAPDATAVQADDVRGYLRFENVRFGYDKAHEILHGVNFEIAPGEVVAIVGQTGSGKSTIASLVPRLYDPNGGRVTLDGRDLREITLDSLRACIGAVPQDITLFHGSIRENIAYARPEATREEIERAAQLAHADEFILAQPNGYDTQIGERGTKLSGGQRQRLAIARALLRDPKILLLDEATSSLDANTEALVQDALETLMRGRTTLVIAHRFSTIQNADRILVLEQGRVVESGRHQELLDAGGLYAHLYQRQRLFGDDNQSVPVDLAMDALVGEAAV